MQVDIIANSDRGAYEYHVRTYLNVKFKKTSKKLEVPLHSTAKLVFKRIKLQSIDGAETVFTGVDTETNIERIIKIRFS